MKIDQYQQVWNLWAEYEEALKKYVFKYTQNKQLTEDIVQDSLLKVYKSCCSNREVRNVRSWLFQIAYHSMIDAFRRLKKAPTITQQQALDHKRDIYQELSAYLEPLIDSLPEQYAVPLKMADLQGLKLQVIADQLGLSLTAVKSRVSRARKMLKREIHSCFHIQAGAHAGIADFNLKQSCKSLQEWQTEKG